MSLEHDDQVSSEKQRLSSRDRRRFARMHLDHPVLCEVDGETVTAQALSISGDGMLFEAERHMAPGTTVEVRIGPPLTPNQPFHASMAITRAEETGLGGARHRMAGRFVKVV